MKTLFTFALAGLLATSSFAIEAEDLKSNSAVHANFKKIAVHLNEGVGKAKIAIYDMNGKKLHSRSVRAKEELHVPYDLNSLPCGEYKVMISTDEEEVMYTVETVEKIEEKPVVYPLMAYGKKVNDETINLLVLGLEEPGVDVKIKSAADDKILHEETINEPNGFRKNFRLRGVPVENVYFEVTDIKGRTRKIYI